MDRDSLPATATQADSGGNKGRNIGRRAFVYGVGGAAAGAGALSLDAGPVQESAAIAPLLLAGAVGVVAGTAGGIAFGASFAGPDDSEVSSSLEWQSHVDEFTRAREDELMLDQTLASLNRDISLVANKAREQAIFNIYEKGIDGGTEAEATAAAEAAINEAYATVERSILTSWNIRFNRAKAVMGLLGSPSSNPGLTEKSSTGNKDGGASQNLDNGSYYETTDYTLYDGQILGVDIYSLKINDYVAELDPLTDRRGDGLSHYINQVWINKPDPANYSSQDDPLDVSYSQVILLDSTVWQDLMADIETEHSTLMGEVSQMVSSYFTPAQNGELDLNNAVGPSYLTDSASNAKDFEEAAQALRAMGYPISNQKVTVELPTESGGTMEVIGRLAWTAHNGNGLVVGQTLNFQNFAGSLMAVVNTPEGQRDSSTDYPGAEQIEITGEFTITTAEGADEVTFADRSLAEADATTNEEISQIFKENQKVNEEATSQVYDTATSGTAGGGGGFLSGTSDRNLGILAVGGAAVVYLLGKN